jgi:thiamine-phosphate pyrophosphorylase
MKPLAECRLYSFVDSAYVHGRQPADIARALCDGGADIVQLRAKGLPKPEVARMAATILPITRKSGVWLVINDYPDVALTLGAPACHLGQEDLFDAGFDTIPALKATLSGGGQLADETQLRVGLSTHSPEQAERAVMAGADYVAVGPVFATGTKPGATPVTLDYVRWAAAHLTVPWFAIGGITLKNLDDVLRAGARRMCVVSAILNASDVAAACGAFKNRLLSAPLP